MTRTKNVRNTTKFKRSIKAISPVIATLLMIAIAVVASLVVYAWVTGYIGGTTSTAGKAIQIQSASRDSTTGFLTVYVQNVGQGAVEFKAGESLYVDDNLVPITSTLTPLAAGQTATLATTTFVPENTKVDIKVTTTDGTFMTRTGTVPTSSGGSQPGVPTIALNPITGPSATSVTVTGTGFAATSAITVRFNSVVMTTSPASVTSSAAGAFSCTFNVPSIAAGPYTVSATDASSGTDTDTFTVTTVAVPTIALNPITGPSATSVTVTGTGFAATSAITVRFNSVVMTTSPASVTSSAAGAFSCTFNVPSIAAGPYTVSATDASSGTDTDTFTVTTVAVPTIALNPITGPSATSVTVTGTGFAATSAITVRFNSVVMTTSPASVTSSAAGAFSCTFNVPSIAAGPYTVSATDASSGTDTDTFTVTTVPFGLDGQNSANTGSGAASSLALTLTTTKPNDVLYLSVVKGDGISVTSVTSSAGGPTWTHRDTETRSSSGISLETWYAVWSSSGSVTITINFNSQTNGAAVVYGISGANTAAPFDGSTSATNNYGTSASRSKTTTNANDFIIGAIAVNNVPALTKDSSYTLVLTQIAPNDARETSVEYRIVTATGTYTPTYSWSGNQGWAMIVDAIAKAP